MKLEAFDWSYFHRKNLLGVDGVQNMFVCQPIFNMLELKKGRDTDYVIGWKSKSSYESKLLLSHGVFLFNIKYFGYKIGIQCNNTPLVVEQNNHATNNQSHNILRLFNILPICLSSQVQ